jgi:hypothetical protein
MRWVRDFSITTDRIVEAVSPACPETVVLERAESVGNRLVKSNSYNLGGIEVFGQVRTTPRGRTTYRTILSA